MVIITTIQTILLLSIIFISLYMGIVVISKNPQSEVHQSFIIFLIGLVLIALGFLFIPYHTPFNLFEKTIYYGGLALLLGLFIFSKRGMIGHTKTQMQYLFVGITLRFICLFIFDVLLPIFGSSRLFIIGSISLLVGIWFVDYAIIRHELFDVRIVLQRGFIYFVILSLTCSVYIASLETIAILVHKMTNIASIISGMITTVLGVFFIRPLGDYFKKTTDRIFFKDRYDYAVAIHMLSKVLHTNVKQTDIVSASSKLLEGIFKSEGVTFYLGEACPEKISISPREISTLIVFEEKCIGILVLGPKRSGDKYTRTDRQLLETFAYQAAVALEKGRLYEKVDKYNTDLEQLVEERTKEIKKLQEDQKQAMIDISHNLQTPLAIIRGELELLPEIEDTLLVKTLRKSIDRVSDFIRQLLHLARLEHSVYTVELSTLNLTHLVWHQIEYFEVMVQEKDTHIVSSAQPDVIVLGHKRLLEELLINLVSNALLYRKPDRKNTITITLTTTDTQAELLIQDNGVGIAPEDLSQLFTRFYQGKRKSYTHGDQTEQAGTGLGLAICKRIIEKHNGTISIDSVFGEKTIVTIRIPLLLPRSF